MERDPHGEQLTPDQQFIRTIDEHFAALDGPGGTARQRTSEETISLIFTEVDGLLRPTPSTAIAKRSIPDQKELAALFWPKNHGHVLDTYASPSPQLSVHVRYSVADQAIWATTTRWLAGVPGGRLYGTNLFGRGRAVRLSDEQAVSFLRCLQRAIPVMPETPDPRQT